VKTPESLVGQGEVRQSQSLLVTRSAVPAGLRYSEYRPYLRRDFLYSCAYCTICESEATTIAFTIDHYEPKSSRPDLADEYSNLMYSCITCNVYKGDLAPPAAAIAAEVRHFRPDQDIRSDHFELSGVRLNPKSPIGEFSIETIELNRLKLRKLRDLRRRLADCDVLISEGVRALRRFRLDELPQHIKGKAASAISDAAKLADKMADEIDGILADYARSPMADVDEEAEARTKERAVRLRTWQQLYPGSWRARQDKPKSGRGNPSRRK
jgi:5-methylcytosine-specific restriction endonuclease McrA